jgi:hypothetical protein
LSDDDGAEDEETTVGRKEKKMPAPTPEDIEFMITHAKCPAGSVVQVDGVLRTYYAGFDLSALAKHISRELENYGQVAPPTGRQEPDR